MPNAAPETTVHDSRASVAAMSRGDVGAVRRGRARADHRDGSARSPRPAGAGPGTTGRRGRHRARAGAARGRGRPGRRATPSSPGTTNRIPRAAPARAPAPDRPTRAARPGRRRAPGRRPGREGSPAPVSPPSSWTRSVSRGSPGSPIRESTTRASRSDSSARVTPTPCRTRGAHRRDAAQQQRGRRAQPQGHVELLDAGPVDCRRGRPPTRRPGGPGRPRAG